MDRISFSTFLTSNTDLDPLALHTLSSNCESRTVKKGEFLIRAGEHCRASFFVENGLLKQYGLDVSGKEHILHFAPEGWLMTDRDSLYFNIPAVYFIEAVEDTTVSLIDEKAFSKLNQTASNFTEFNERLLHSHIRQLTARIYQMMSASAEERYLKFVKTYPDILLRVPQSAVASYLGITPESLSRVRKSLASRNSGK